MKWIERLANPEHVSELVSALKLDPVLARVLAARGIHTSTQAKKYLETSLADLADPDLFAGMPQACARLTDAILKDETIGIFGDYDVDGVTSTVLLWEFLEQLGARAVVTIPDRLKEGYGLSLAGVHRLREQGASLLVTVDCGITAHEEVEAANALGVDVIVIDHHTVLVDLPKAVAVINPHRKDCPREATHLCAVGVVFNLCLSLRRMLRERGFFQDRPEPNLRHSLDLVALGTVADVVPLIEDNRIFVQQGIGLMKQSRRVGIKALLDVAEIEQSQITASTLGFHLGPRINAAGRLEDAMQAVHLLRETNYPKARVMAESLDKNNRSRRDLEKQIVEEAILEVSESKEHQDSFVTVVGNERWHPGVVGIVASRLVERFGKPALVIGEKGKGSGRSIPALHLYETLCQVKEHLIGFGGHAHAVGVQVDLNRLRDLRKAMNAHVSQILTRDDLVQPIFYDGAVDLEQISLEWVNGLKQAAPFGRSNPEPVFRINQVSLVDFKELRGGHLKGFVQGNKNVPFIAFGMAEKQSALTRPVDVLVVPEINTWMGRNQIQLRVKDWL